ncbi:PREDICTED: cytosolic sulfotransferase 12-like [Tarenaya hassleriana]|uniref:cytosolic sulfotransferase 12-like n=1 Tax=Tarenaya hassleriana TaxID=28532 RepID=UPI00053C154C|nr:PREDICTED: cytosolic sulfotransferase 12-like [Tarenaya hassleriana]
MTNSDASVLSFLGDEGITEEIKDMMSSLPRQKGWMVKYMYQFQGFWLPPSLLQGTINCQKHFQAQDSDVILVTNPKSGTTWLKALIFALINRKKFHDSQHQHPLLTHNPHALVPFLEEVYYKYPQVLPDDVVSSSSSCPRFFGAHMAHVSLPDSIKGSSCKIVYCCRNPKDMFVSFWHFGQKMASKESLFCPIEEAVKLFCEGSFLSGSFWDHVLGYWEASQKNPDKVFFITYEEMKERPRTHLKQMADFLGCSFTKEEEEKGMVDEIIRLCSFESLSSFEVNRKGKLPNGIETNTFFRKGKIGGWRDTLTDSLAEEIDRTSEQKFHGSGFKFQC